MAEPGFGIYVHWPFCAAKCPYCDFNSHVSQGIDPEAWASAYRSEVRRYAEELGPREVDSVYFGGGTPSLMRPDTVAATLEQIDRDWQLSDDAEITLEANPTSAEAERFAGYHAAGVNRLSLGVQALNDEDLGRLGRLHDATEAFEALDLARKTFDRVSFDLIYARQNQSLNEWIAELGLALSLEPDHLSLYQLTIEPGTAFGKRHAAGKLAGLPNEALSAEMFESTQALCEAAGLPMYEISNHARPGSESRHNLLYWRSGDWVGIGPGAHGRFMKDGQRIATETPLTPQSWLASPGESRRERVPLTEQAEEALMMGLRLREGVDIKDFEHRYAYRLDRERIENLAELGVVVVAEGQLRLTPEGILVANAVLVELLRD